MESRCLTMPDDIYGDKRHRGCGIFNKSNTKAGITGSVSTWAEGIEVF